MAEIDSNMQGTCFVCYDTLFHCLLFWIFS